MSQNIYLAQGPASRIVDTLRISEREAANILDALDGAQHDMPAAELRDSDRLPCRPNKGLVVQIQHPGGSNGVFLVWPRDVSRTGMSFLHGNFIYPGTTIVVNLRRPAGPLVRITGRIIRCRHIGGIVHEIGIKFDQALEMAVLAQYTRGDQQPGGCMPCGNTPAKLSGRVLVIDDLIDDRELLGFYCTNCGLESVEATMIEDAKNRLQNQRFDLVLTDVELSDGCLEEIIEQLRASRYPGPVIAVWSGTNHQYDHDTLIQAGFSDVLTKPLTPQAVAELLAKYLQASNGGRRVSEALLSEQWSNEQMRPLILAFLGRLDGHVERFKALTDREPGTDIDSSLLKLCLDLHGTSGSYGFPTISDAAMELHRLASDESAQAGQLKAQVDRLLALIQSACLVRQRTKTK